MSKLLLIFMLVFATAIVGCSSSGEKSSDEVEAEWGDDEFEEQTVTDDSSDETEDNDFEDDFSEDDERSPSSVGSLNIDEQQDYLVEKGDTLMKISFKLFGDISQWKTIADLNPGSEQMLLSGTKIKVPLAESPFVWQPVGLPYIIQSGDTLGTISKDKYGTPSKWKKIYNNNKPLIKDPNKIYAGFTIYYEEEESMSAL
jgi:nucleoid-associated protein YgaU